MSGNITLVSTDPQEVVERVLQVPEKNEEPTFGEVAEESAETPAESQTAQAESEEKHQSKRSQKVKRLATKLTKSEQENQELRERIERLEQAGRVEQPKEPKSAPDPSAYPVPEPKLEDFPNPQDFIKASIKHDADEREWKRERKAETDARDAQVQAHFERVEDARSKYDDFDDVVGPTVVHFRDSKSQESFYQAIAENEDGPDVLYHIGKNPEIAEEFGDMTPGQVAAKVGRIAATLDKKSSPEPQKEATRRINPVGGGSKRPDVPTDRSSLSHAEWKRLRKAGQIR